VPKIELNRPVAEWELLLDPKYRYIFVKGGRSSSKSHGVAGYLTERSFTEKDLRIVCLREIQKSINRSSKDLIESKIKAYGLGKYYKGVLTETRKLMDDGMFLYQGMNDLTSDNVKSLENFKIAWFEEAQNASFKTLKTLRPTIRAEGSQLIFTWNPKLPTDPIDELCASMQNEPDVLVIHVNYTDNPFLTDTMVREVELEKKTPQMKSSNISTLESMTRASRGITTQN
jgi:phage terminase large subunit